MLLTILGSGTALPVAHRGPTAAWLRSGSTSVLVDCGSGALQKLYRAGGDLAELDALVLTHAHLDHLGDLTTVLFALRAGVPRREPLRLYYSAPLAPYLDGLNAVFGDWLGRRGHVVRKPLRVGERASLGELALETFEVSHHATSLGFRFRERATGLVLALPSDTGLCQSLVDAVSGVDALVIECAATDEHPRDGHMAPADVLHLLAEARPGAAVLTHFYPEGEAAGVAEHIRRLAETPVWAATDGMTIRLEKGGLRVVGEHFAAPSGPSSAPAPAYPDEAAPVRSSRDEIAEEAAIHALLDAELAALESTDWSQRKFDGPARPPHAAREPVATRVQKSWTPEAAASLRLNRGQKRLLERALAAPELPETNLRGLTREDGFVRLKAAVETWATQGVRYARVITGKGKHSADVPVLKLVALNWLDSLAGARFVSEWAPEIARDGNFGSLVVALRG